MSITIDGTTGISGNNGSAGTPAVQGEDTNTGIFFPAADTVAVATAGTERLRVDSSGNVGIGVAPSAWATLVPAIQIGGGGSFIAAQGSGTANSDSIYIGTNAHFDGTNWLYKETNNASYFLQAGGQHQWFTAPSGTAGNAITFTQAMTLDESGNVGIGTAAPATKLEIASSVMGDNFIRLNQNASSGTNFGVPVGKIQMNWIGDPNWASINFEDERGSGTGTHRSGISFTTRDGNDAGLERMRINNTGIVFVGKSGSNIAVAGWQFDPSGGGSLVGTVSSGTNELFTFNNLSTTGTAQLDFRTANSEKGSISWNNTNTAFNTTSDYRLKENVAPMQNALDTVAQLNPVTYTWKADGSAGQGFIAHELQAVVPDCVTGEKDAVDAEGNPQYQGVDTSFLVATLVKAIQELTARVAELEAR